MQAASAAIRGAATSSTSTSSGSTRWTAPGRPLVAARKARRIVSGSLSARLTVAFHLTAAASSACWSIAVSVPRPSSASGTSVVRQITGIDEPFASATPGTM